jgi:hypothetical protein
MNHFSFMHELCESKLFSSRQALAKWSNRQCATAAYWYIIGLAMMVQEPATKHWATQYCETTARQNDFATWRSDANDLYVLLFALSDPDDEIAIARTLVRDWLRHPASTERTRRLFARLDSMLQITSSEAKAIRRLVMDWPECDDSEQHDLASKVRQRIKAIAPRSELLSHLTKLEAETVAEAATTGATGAAAAATMTGGLGSGFDPQGGQWRSVFPPPISRRRPLRLPKKKP